MSVTVHPCVPHYVDELIQMSISGKECMYEKSEKESIEDRMAFLRFSGFIVAQRRRKKQPCSRNRRKSQSFR